MIHTWHTDECIRCGMRRHWPGAGSDCAGSPVLSEDEAQRRRCAIDRDNAAADRRGMSRREASAADGGVPGAVTGVYVVMGGGR